MAEAQKDGVDLSTATATSNGDEASQITAVENAVSQQVKVIILTVNGPAVNPALRKAKDAGILVLGVDAVTDPPSTTDMTFATDNRSAGTIDGQWAAKTLKGQHATIALLDAFTDKVIPVDINRDGGFLDGMGIKMSDPQKVGSEAPEGSYSGGTYTIACHVASKGAVDDRRTGMENCLSKNPNINVVYAINEPAAQGAYNALQAAGKDKNVLVVAIDGGCSGVGFVKTGQIGATAMQFPTKQAEMAIQAGVAYVKNGTKPTASPGLDFHDAGVALVTDHPVEGVPSITSAEGATKCWGG